MTVVGINAGFGDSLAAEFAALKSFGFSIVRQDVFAHYNLDTVAQLVEEFADAPVLPLFLIGGGKIEHDDGESRIEPHELAAITTTVVETAKRVGLDEYLIEIGNEPDIAHPGYSDRPYDFAEAVRQCRDAARSLAFDGPIVVGGIANLNDRGFEYLAELLAAPTLPLDDLVIGFHRYPETGRGPLCAHDRYQSRRDEFETLLGLVGDRPVACTEFGYHTASARPFTLDDEDVADATLWDLGFYSGGGALFACVYQLNDGPSDAYVDRYGVRALGGAWKPVAYKIRELYGD
jgi:hypothetical protein